MAVPARQCEQRAALLSATATQDHQQDKDWFYRSEERRWITMNDHSGWRRIERVAGKTRRSLLHVA
jgi:hypothetical protein